MHTESDAAMLSLAITICDALIESNLLTTEVLAKKLTFAARALEEQKLPIAAGIVGTVSAAISDPVAAKARRELATLLTSPLHGDKH